MNSNPYSLTFGKSPEQMISRTAQLMTITDAFLAEKPVQQLFIITGVRGSGKTVLMTEASRIIAKEKNWITVELNPERDMLVSLASKLSSENALAEIFKSARINLSFFGFGLEVTGEPPVTDIETALTKMLTGLKKHGKKLLITIDEAANTKNMKVFASTFQILLRLDLPVFLLMTGLYENINSLQNEKTLTFLYRAPKIEIKPLNIGTIAANYRSTIGVDESTALSMAQLTKGYSFAFQVLGYFAWAEKAFTQTVKISFKQYLEEYVYEKIWSELSGTDKRVVYGIANTPGGRVKDIRGFTGMDTNQFNPYRSRLIKKGLVDGSTNGYLRFTLPLFGEFVIENYY